MERRRRGKHRASSEPPLKTTSELPSRRKTASDMALYSDLSFQDSMKEELFRCRLHALERKCCAGVEKLKALVEAHLQNGFPVADILEKTKSLLTLRKALLSHAGYSKHSRDILRLFPDAEEDVAPLCF